MIKTHTIETFKNLPSVIADFMDTLPEAVLDRKRNEETWTAREHLYHIVDVQDMLLSRILIIRDDENPIMVPFYPENEEINRYESIAAALKKYKDLREKQLEVLSGLSEAVLAKKAVHKQYSEYSIPVIVNHMIFHEYWHMYRMEEICFVKDEFFI